MNGKKPAPMRALTDQTPRISYADSGINFRQYNEMYEEWLEARHRDTIRPYTEQRSPVFDIYTTESGRQMVHDTEQSVRIITRRLQQTLKAPEELERYKNLWKEMGRRVREDFMLKILEDECRNFESLGQPWPREDCPELTLEWATGVDREGVANWIRIWQQLGTEEPKPQEGELPYFNLRNDRWDRVNGVFEIENTLVPVKKSIRAFVHDGIARRNQFLRQFIRELSGCVVSLLPPPSIKSSRYLTLASTSSRKRQSSRPRNLKPESRNRMQPRCSLAYKRKESVSGSASTLGSRR